MVLNYESHFIWYLYFLYQAFTDENDKEMHFLLAELGISPIIFRYCCLEDGPKCFEEEVLKKPAKAFQSLLKKSFVEFSEI